MNDWTPSQARPGYREKTIQRGPATIVIRRPILGEKERAKREKQTIDTLTGSLRGYLMRCPVQQDQKGGQHEHRTN